MRETAPFRLAPRSGGGLRGTRSTLGFLRASSSDPTDYSLAGGLNRGSSGGGVGGGVGGGNDGCAILKMAHVKDKITRPTTGNLI